MNRRTFRRLICLIASIGLISLTACTMRGNMVFHTFGFDTLHDSPGVFVLDYKYGGGGQLGTYPEKERVQLGERFGHHSIYGAMPRGEFLYVKWRIETGQIYEDKVNLKTRLPADIENLEIYFVVRGPQLYVYLIWPYDAKHEYPPEPLKRFGRVKQEQIYPDQSK